MNYSCWGAARQVTGSMHLLEWEDGYKVLIDCGLDYEAHNKGETNLRFPFNPSEIDVVILTHAHIDHSGNVPNLIKQGYKGQVICTEPTAFLVEKLWADSVSIQNKDSKRRKKGAVRLYGFKEVKDSIQQLLTLDFNRPFDLSNDLRIELVEAGHILGASSVIVTDRRTGLRMGFTGDLGNYGSKLVVDPVPMPDLDVLVCESTYGNRLHHATGTPEEVLKQHVLKTCVQREGKLIIPAFSVGRTQAILYTLNRLMASGEIPKIRVFADSPLGMVSSRIHARFSDYLNAEARADIEAGMDLFHAPEFTFINDKSDEEDLEYYREPHILVSSAGMLEGGRIQHHIAAHIENPMCTILMAGFCAPGTLGAQLLDGRTEIQIKRRHRYVYAKIERTDVFSAHPDKAGLKRYVLESIGPRLRQVFLVHGEERAVLDLKAELEGEIQIPIAIPNKGELFDI